MRRLGGLVMVVMLLAGCAGEQNGAEVVQVQPDALQGSAGSAQVLPANGVLPVTEATPQQAQPTEEAHEDSDEHSHEVADLTHLPVGDGRISGAPQVGYVWACNTNFGMPGAFASGDWFNGDGTYDLTAKPTVDGAVSWPSIFDIALVGEMRVFTGNGLPDHVTGNYPIAATDDAYQYDRNPNSIREQQVRIELTANPVLAAQPSCVGMGAIGIMTSGVVIFNALDGGGNDAVAHEIQDDCGGHPQQNGQYHYHSFSECLDDAGTGHSALIGWAFDGFGIFGPRGEDGEVLTNANLDACHGHTHVIEWNGQQVEMYHYHTTYEYPYTLGCYMGTPVRGIMQGGGPGGQPGGLPGQPGGPGGGPQPPRP